MLARTLLVTLLLAAAGVMVGTTVFAQGTPSDGPPQIPDDFLDLIDLENDVTNDPPLPQQPGGGPGNLNNQGGPPPNAPPEPGCAPSAGPVQGGEGDCPEPSAPFAPLLPDLPIEDAGQGLGPFLNGVFAITIGIAGILAVIMIAIGGFRYMMTESPFTMGDAKGQITDALIGLAIILASVLILSTINPELVQLNPFRNVQSGPPAAGNQVGAGAGQTEQRFTRRAICDGSGNCECPFISGTTILAKGPNESGVVVCEYNAVSQPGDMTDPNAPGGGPQGDPGTGGDVGNQGDGGQGGPGVPDGDDIPDPTQIDFGQPVPQSGSGAEVPSGDPPSGSILDRFFESASGCFGLCDDE